MILTSATQKLRAPGGLAPAGPSPAMEGLPLFMGMAGASLHMDVRFLAFLLSHSAVTARARHHNARPTSITVYNPSQ
jgi:hypothetical protein